MLPFRTAIAVLYGLAAAAVPARALSPEAHAAEHLAPAPLRIVSPERPPYVFSASGTGNGPAVDLVRRVARTAGIAFDPLVMIQPFQRAVRILDDGGALYPALLRTPEREARYQWIGEVYEDHAVMFTRTGTATVTDVADARQLGRISVMRGSQLQLLLRSFDLRNFETNTSEEDNARLLQAGRIDGWFTLRTVGRTTWKLLGFAPQTLQAGEPFALIPFWIAASPDLPAATVTRLRAAYARLRKNGEYARIIAPLRESPS